MIKGHEFWHRKLTRYRLAHWKLPFNNQKFSPHQIKVVVNGSCPGSLFKGKAHDGSFSYFEKHHTCIAWQPFTCQPISHLSRSALTQVQHQDLSCTWPGLLLSPSPFVLKLKSGEQKMQINNTPHSVFQTL